MPNWQVSVSSCSRYLTTGLLGRDCQSPVGVKTRKLKASICFPVCLCRRKSRLYSVTSSQTGEHLTATVIRAARLAAILLPIARGLRPAEKGGARL